jgi:hypothetical protein
MGSVGLILMVGSESLIILPSHVSLIIGVSICPIGPAD